MTVFKKFLPVISSGIIFGFVIWQMEPPQSLTSASILQVLLLFAPLFTFLVFGLNLYFRFYPRSLIISLGIIILLVLKTLDTFNIISVAITIAAVTLISKSFKKVINWKTGSRSNTLIKIPRLSHLEKQRKQ